MMHITIPACFCLIALSAGAVAAENSITFYRDGTLYQQEAGAVKGVIDVPLAAGYLDHSITVIPSPGTSIISVESRSSAPSSSPDKDLDTLTEQRKRCEDRLQALETREAIFTAAAKAQSGKAPRRTKANPDPMLAIRQGTDFAIAQLEAVYTARRKTLQEIQKINARLATAKNGRSGLDSSVRVMVTPLRGRVTLRYATAAHGWQPLYNLHLTDDGTAQLQLVARITETISGQQARISPGSLHESPMVKTFPVLSNRVLLGNYRLPITAQSSAEGVFNRFFGMITNNSPDYLAPGDSGLFRNGRYLGKFIFEGLSSGRSRAVSVGL